MKYAIFMMSVNSLWKDPLSGDAGQVGNRRNQATSIGDLSLGGKPTILTRYGFAVFCALLAFLIRFGFERLIGYEVPFMFFVTAVLVASAYGGAWPGVVALVLGLVSGVFLFIGQHGAANLTPVGIPQFFRYFYTASVGIILIEILHRSQARTRAAVDDLRAEVARRMASEERLSEAQAEISRHANELEKRVVERTAELEGLLYHIAHNLRAPLRAMEGSATLLEQDYSSVLDETGRDYTRRIGKAASRMDVLIQDLLEFGRLSHVEIKLERTDLSRVVKRVLQEAAWQIKARGAEITVEDSMPQVWASERLTEQIISNLLENSLKFVSPGLRPRIRIFAEERNSTVRLWMEDNGIGIESEYHERIFGVFEQLHGRKYEGTGIGLAIVKQSAHRMSGQVGVESRPGQGSRFWVEFNRISNPEQAVTWPAR